jgi:hypothetical protein
MNPKHYVYGNALGLKLHWIYDRKYLKELSMTHDLFSMRYDSNHFKLSETSYDSYPNQVSGDTTTQGVIFKKLLEMYEKNHTLTRKDYEDVIQTIFMKERYQGYQESFIKNYLSNIKGETHILLEDDHTVYMLPYLILQDINQASLLSQVFNTSLSHQKDLILFDDVIKNIQSLGFKKAYEKALKELDVPKYYHDVLIDCDLNTFIETYAGMSCSIKFAMPVIYYLMYRYPLKEALYYNFLVGGSISERAGLICYMLGSLEEYQEDMKALKP